jgi:hypothetical protein
MENSQHRRPDEVARSGTVNINYSRRNELTQDVEIRAPRAVRVVRRVRIGLLPATAMASTLPTDTGMTKSKESSFQIAEFAINHPILAMLVLGLIALIGSIAFLHCLPAGCLSKSQQFSI